MPFNMSVRVHAQPGETRTFRGNVEVLTDLQTRGGRHMFDGVKLAVIVISTGHTAPWARPREEFILGMLQGHGLPRTS